DALARRGLLHLGDHRRLAFFDAACQGRGEGTRRRRIGDAGADFGERQPGAARLYFADLVFEDAPQDVRRGRDVHGHSARKFLSSRWPCWVRIDSGWNCTPYTGCSRCLTPMISPSSTQALTAKQSGSVSRSTASEW